MNIDEVFDEIIEIWKDDPEKWQEIEGKLEEEEDFEGDEELNELMERLRSMGFVEAERLKSKIEKFNQELKDRVESLE